MLVHLLEKCPEEKSWLAVDPQVCFILIFFSFKIPQITDFSLSFKSAIPHSPAVSKNFGSILKMYAPIFSTVSLSP